jgi:nitroreductase
VSDPFYEVMRCAPSTRHFTDEPVPREVLERVLDNARFAPSGGNRQGWRVVVVTDRDTRRRLRELYEPHWMEYTQATGARAAL